MIRENKGIVVDNTRCNVDFGAGSDSKGAEKDPEGADVLFGINKLENLESQNQQLDKKYKKQKVYLKELEDKVLK